MADLSSFSSKERTARFLIGFLLEDRWEHAKLCGLEINVHKARKMGNVINYRVCTVSELQKNGLFSHLSLSWQAPTKLAPSVIPVPAPAHRVCAALDWPTCILRKFCAFFGVIQSCLGFFNGDHQVYFSSLYEMVAYNLCIKFQIFIF